MNSTPNLARGRTRSRLAPALLVLALIAPTLAASAQEAASASAERVDRWNDDLDYLTALLRGSPIPGQDRQPGQKDFAKLYPRFDTDVAALRADLPILDNGTIAWRIARIFAGAHIGHNLILPDDTWMLPLQVEWAADGPVILAAGPGMQEMVGQRLLRLGDLDPAAYLDRVSPYLAYETAEWRLLLTGMVLPRRALLRELGLVQDDGRVRVAFETAAGSKTLELEFVRVPAATTGLKDVLALPVPLRDSEPDQTYYWRRYLPDAQVLYIQYRRCADDPALSMREFAEQTAAEIDARKPRRVVVDLRFNLGGDEKVIRPLVAVLADSRDAIGRPFVLTGPMTYSSAVRAADELRRRTGATVVGSGTGGLLGGYGEIRNAALPHSRLGVQWTTRQFPDPVPVVPDLAVVPTSEDLRAGRDAVLEAAIAAP